MLVAANALLTLFVGLYLYRIAIHLQEKDDQIGRIMQTLFEKLESLPDLPTDFEPPTAIEGIIANFLSGKLAASNIGRSDVGQFTRAEIIPPE